MSDDATHEQDRARGALLGLACGDALGAPLIGMTREQAQIKHATVDAFLGGGLYLLAPGVTTGRGRLAQAAGLALLEEAPNTESTLAAYLRFADAGLPGLGETTQASLDRIRDGMAPDAAAREAHAWLERKSAGIGPAIRTVPYAIRLARDPDALVDAVVADARLTHLDPAAHAAAAALALWVREHLLGEEDPAVALEAARERLAARLDLPDVLPAPAAIRRTRVRATAYAPDVLHAVAKHALGARSAKGAIVGAANEAGASSALGAATGAVVGARFGAEALPRDWCDLLSGASRWRQLADRLSVASPD
jgi:ADP-ribosyl-[dinitrogen reductase] hydrolase